VLCNRNCAIIFGAVTSVALCDATLTSVTYVVPAPDANKNIKFPHLYEELIIFV
jgi:hypothetical protein